MFGIAKRLRSSARLQRFRDLWRKPAPVILMYHRVAELPYDPWGLSVAPAKFAEQLRSLVKARTVVSMDMLAQQLERGELNGSEVAISFDDGYVDNLTVAKPLLEAASAPATVFLTTGRLGASDEFWWDELAHMCLGGRFAVDTTVHVAGRSLKLAFEAQTRPTSDWTSDAPPSSERERLYLELWTLLQRLEEATRSQCMQDLRQQLGTPEALSGNLPMRREDVPRLIDGGLVGVGGHARTHLALTALSSAEKRVEIESSKRDIESLTGRPVSGFAYPFGDRDDEAKRLTREAGYAWAVSTHSAAIQRRLDLFDLPRLQVLNWTGPQLLERISQLRPAA